jgi:hypothetical protein
MVVALVPTGSLIATPRALTARRFKQYGCSIPFKTAIKLCWNLAIASKEAITLIIGQRFCGICVVACAPTHHDVATWDRYSGRNRKHHSERGCTSSGGAASRPQLHFRLLCTRARLAWLAQACVFATRTSRSTHAALARKVRAATLSIPEIFECRATLACCSRAHALRCSCGERERLPHHNARRAGLPERPAQSPRALSPLCKYRKFFARVMLCLCCLQPARVSGGVVSRSAFWYFGARVRKMIIL